MRPSTLVQSHYQINHFSKGAIVGKKARRGKRRMKGYRNEHHPYPPTYTVVSVCEFIIYFLKESIRLIS